MTLQLAPRNLSDLPLRLPIHSVCRADQRRVLVGRIESGTVRTGDEIVFSPFNKTSVVAGIEPWPTNGSQLGQAGAGEWVGLTLTEQIFVERGHVGSHRADAPIESNRIKAKVLWTGEHAPSLGGQYTLKLATQEVNCQITSLEPLIDAAALAALQAHFGAEATSQFTAGNPLAEVTLQLRQPLALDNFERIPPLGRFTLFDESTLCGVGLVFGGLYTDRSKVVSQHITWSDGEITALHRARRNGHKGAVVWLTGLSGSGKSTIAHALERELYQRHFHVYVLDGDNIRYGLNSNLGFSPEDRIENIRRVSEVARLMADGGFVTISAFISPYQADRRRAREIALEGGCEFIEVYVNASLQVCERRDPKNLYKKARAGEIKQFTGIDAPYEAPTDPEIIVHTDEQTAAESVSQILERLLPRLVVE